METKAWEIEEELQNRNVFVNGLTDKRAHSDSYMTVVDFVAYDKAFTEIKGNYTKEQWLDASEYWIRMNYLCPTLSIIGRIVKRYFN